MTFLFGVLAGLALASLVVILLGRWAVATLGRPPAARGGDDKMELRETAFAVLNAHDPARRSITTAKE